MQKINFVKTVASGNDFIIIKVTSLQSPATSLNYKKIAKELCERRFGIGADGLLVIEPSQKADFRMCIFNPDGSEAEMCGNGARCAALYATRFTSHASRHTPKDRKIKIETKAGIVEAEIKKVTSLQSPVTSKKIKIKMLHPKNFKADIPLKIGSKTILVNFVEVGVPHSVIFVEDLGKIDVQSLGKEIREHQEFQPQGTNVNFVQVLDENNLQIRTYERGVEKETLSCGTGSTASAVIAYRRSLIAGNKISVHTRGEVLKVYFDKQLKDVFLEGKAKIVYEGKYEI